MSIDAYRVNDVLTALANEAGVSLDDETLNELTHHVKGVIDGQWGGDLLYTVSRSSVENGLGRKLSEDEAATLSKALGHSSIPDALDEVIFHVCGSPEHGDWDVAYEIRTGYHGDLIKRGVMQVYNTSFERVADFAIQALTPDLPVSPIAPTVHIMEITEI